MRNSMLMGYAGFCKGCGELTAAVMDVPGCEKEVIIGLVISHMDGLEVRRMALKDIRSRLRSCQCGTHRKRQAGTWIMIYPGPCLATSSFDRAMTGQAGGVA